MFEQLNSAYFAARLPAYDVTFSRRLPGGRYTMGRCDDKRRAIRISSELASSWKQVRETLLHEMCHIGDPFHGKRFQEKLRMLASRGEAWALEEERDCARTTWPQIQARTKADLFDLALGLSRRGNGVPERLTQRVANRIGWSLGELRKSMPWVDRTWRNARREAMSVRRASRASHLALVPS